MSSKHSGFKPALTIDNLRAVFARLTSHLESLGYTEFQLTHDYYWDFSAQDRYAIETSAEQPEPVVGQLSSDWKALCDILPADGDPIAHDLTYLASILRAIGDEIIA